jgi:ribosomal protein S18 acetylase RimI-like enzyme
MATAPLPRTEILDLRQVRSRHLAPLFEEEERLWLSELHWDFKPSVRLIEKHIDTRSLTGYVALVDGQVGGYCFFVYEETSAPGERGAPNAWRQKGLIGDLFVRRAYQSSGLGVQLLERAVETLKATPGVTRLEAQIMPFGSEPLGPVFAAEDFRCYPRLFMYKALGTTSTAEANSRGEYGYGTTKVVPSRREEWLVEPWEDRHFDPMGELIVSAYAGHVDSNINDQYGSRAGALKFLKNIVVFPGCGVFRPEGSFVAVADTRGRSHGAERTGTTPAAPHTTLVGALLVSQVAPRVAHITQVCVRRELQGQGLGAQLLERSLGALRARGYEGVSLSVTANNNPAVGLYRRFGFVVLKEFAAYTWDKA